VLGFFNSTEPSHPAETHYSDRNGVPYVVREGSEFDGTALYDYKSKIFAETEMLLQAPDDFESDPDREAIFLRRFRASQNSIYLIACREDVIVGTLSLFGGPYRRTRHVAQLGMGVLQESWGLGIGGVLMAESMTWARNNPLLSKIGLQVYDTNTRAIKLYEKKGFQKEGLLKGDVQLDDGTLVDLVVMSCFLEEVSSLREVE
jgi:RimJ/RimL family protein N-acetyltransferase